MVHTRNGRNYSIQPDGCGKGRGKTKSRSSKSSPIKTHLEDTRLSPHSPRSVPTDFDVNSEPELIHDSTSTAEPFSSGSNRNISMPIQKLVQISQRRGVGNMPKPLAGGHELLLTHQEVKKIKNWLKNQSLLSIDQKKELEMPPALETEAPVVCTNSKPAPEVSKDKPKGPQKGREVPRTIKARKKAKKIGKDLTHKGIRSPNWSLQPWTVYSTWPGL
ncbi:hypothetical protein O181_075080 [Austropuccinia psidii MF-1]|uniref:Uncharacterized protein n=1 Tax=Austropuccinia psidii MF-1 TaxID=1389203 RepID=A0A9Q3F5W4_9BASI|nr:hypothetical protein [Austropuccinia psidii MF-1]